MWSQKMLWKFKKLLKELLKKNAKAICIMPPNFITLTPN